jgi:hypothetical protein
MARAFDQGQPCSPARRSCLACHRSPRGGTRGSPLSVSAEAGLAGSCAHSAAVKLLPMSPIAFANLDAPATLLARADEVIE